METKRHSKPQELDVALIAPGDMLWTSRGWERVIQVRENACSDTRRVFVRANGKVRHVDFVDFDCARVALAVRCNR